MIFDLATKEWHFFEDSLTLIGDLESLADGSVLLFQNDLAYRGSNNRVIVADPVTGMAIWTSSFPGVQLMAITATPDASHLFVGTDDGRIIMIDRATGARSNITGSSTSVQSMDLDESGTMLVAARSAKIQVYDLRPVLEGTGSATEVHAFPIGTSRLSLSGSVLLANNTSDGSGSRTIAVDLGQVPGLQVRLDKIIEQEEAAATAARQLELNRIAELNQRIAAIKATITSIENHTVDLADPAGTYQQLIALLDSLPDGTRSVAEFLAATDHELISIESRPSGGINGQNGIPGSQLWSDDLVGVSNRTITLVRQLATLMKFFSEGVDSSLLADLNNRAVTQARRLVHEMAELTPWSIDGQSNRLQLLIDRDQALSAAAEQFKSLAGKVLDLPNVTIASMQSELQSLKSDIQTVALRLARAIDELLVEQKAFDSQPWNSLSSVSLASLFPKSGEQLRGTLTVLSMFGPTVTAAIDGVRAGDSLTIEGGTYFGTADVRQSQPTALGFATVTLDSRSATGDYHLRLTGQDGAVRSDITLHWDRETKTLSLVDVNNRFAPATHLRDDGTMSYAALFAAANAEQAGEMEQAIVQMVKLHAAGSISTGIANSFVMDTPAVKELMWEQKAKLGAIVNSLGAPYNFLAMPRFQDLFYNSFPKWKEENRQQTMQEMHLDSRNFDYYRDAELSFFAGHAQNFDNDVNTMIALGMKITLAMRRGGEFEADLATLGSLSGKSTGYAGWLGLRYPSAQSVLSACNLALEVSATTIANQEQEYAQSFAGMEWIFNHPPADYAGNGAASPPNNDGPRRVAFQRSDGTWLLHWVGPGSTLPTVDTSAYDPKFAVYRQQQVALGNTAAADPNNTQIRNEYLASQPKIPTMAELGLELDLAKKEVLGIGVEVLIRRSLQLPVDRSAGTWYVQTGSPDHVGTEANAIDLNLRGTNLNDLGKAVRAMADGTVVYIDESNGQMILRHEIQDPASGKAIVFFTEYVHMQNMRVELLGQNVTSGTQIGEVGRVAADANHPITSLLHTNVIYDGRSVDLTPLVQGPWQLTIDPPNGSIREIGGPVTTLNPNLLKLTSQGALVINGLVVPDKTDRVREYALHHYHLTEPGNLVPRNVQVFSVADTNLTVEQQLEVARRVSLNDVTDSRMSRTLRLGEYLASIGRDVERDEIIGNAETIFVTAVRKFFADLPLKSAK